MRLSELRQRLLKLREDGYISSARRGSTGVGYTLEQRLGLSENNLPIPDIGGRVEVKATRTTSNSLITLFTFNRSVWIVPQREVIEKYGYRDAFDRQALKSTVNALVPNRQQLTLRLDETEPSFTLVHALSNTTLAKWSLYRIVGKFITKFARLLFVRADARRPRGRTEEFHYADAKLLSEPDEKAFLEALRRGALLIDVRMHIERDGRLRNRGTAVRVRENELPLLFSRSIDLM